MIRSMSFPDELMEKLQVIAKEKYVTVSTVILMACAEFVKAELIKKEGESPPNKED